MKTSTLRRKKDLDRARARISKIERARTEETRRTDDLGSRFDSSSQAAFNRGIGRESMGEGASVVDEVGVAWVRETEQGSVSAKPAREPECRDEQPV
jgi:hypothetical protein